MQLLKSFSALLLFSTIAEASDPLRQHQKPLTENDRARIRAACPDYLDYSKYGRHPPFSDGPMKLPFQRPSEECRTFASPAVEKVISDVTSRMLDKDLARIFENAFPNTLDTTVRWHVDGSQKKRKALDGGKWDGAHSFIVTGDINAEWLRDSTNQLAQYQPLTRIDKAIFNLILGAINTQAEYVIQSPYCNAFQPPPPSHLAPSNNGQSDRVHPAFEPHVVFECKWELDSLASFLALSSSFATHSGSTSFITKRWLLALNTVFAVIDEQSMGTFDPSSGTFRRNEYTFQRDTNIGSETLWLSGIGSPLASKTGLVRSAFRPSDDATILGFFIPGNAQMAVELARLAPILEDAGYEDIAKKLKRYSDDITSGIWEHGVVRHKRFGDVFAYEVDGYGSAIIMDDANMPSLLALPAMGFVKRSDKIYQNTRKMILSRYGNPYYLTGAEYSGIGGPHIGPRNAWPMSTLVRIMTSESEDEILQGLESVKKASGLGLVHESVNVDHVRDYTRSWFAWANSVFAQTILDLAARKPEILFGEGARKYVVGQS